MSNMSNAKLVGFFFFILAVLLAGNWLYYPFETLQTESLSSAFVPIPFYPKNDPADYTYNSSPVYLPTKELYYIQWNYVWTNSSYHTPDEESIRTYIKNNKLDHISICVHYEWMEIYSYETIGEHVKIYFTPIYHTPYVSTSSLFITGFLRILPILICVALGIIFFYYDFKRK